MTDTLRSWLGLSALSLSLAGCATLAVASAPEKEAAKDVSPLRKSADTTFWTTLHSGNYDGIGIALEQLQRAYLEEPNDPSSAAHIGFMHIWRVSERARLENVPATITDDMMLARRYFDEAVRLDDSDARTQGFLAATLMAEGQIHRDEKLKRQGYFAMKDAVSAWPEFNLFTSGYSMSGLHHEDENYAEALDAQWQTLDVCAGESVDRKTADYSRYMSAETRVGAKRACWNSWIAPHNFEGFFLNMGDMLVKAGEPETARKVYAQAKLSKQYSAWPYREVLERRIEQASQNVQHFRAPPTGQAAANSERLIMGQGSFACTGCHQRGQEPELERFPAP